MYANTSGQGSTAPVPPEIRGWNWGGFLLGWIWAVGNGAYLWALVAFIVPFFNIVLGIKGNEWAWQSKRWNSVEHFKQVQRTWTRVGIILLVAVLGLTCVGILLVSALTVISSTQTAP